MSHDANGDYYVPKINAVAQGFLDELLKERDQLSDDFPLLNQVVDDVIDRVYACGRIPGRDLPADVFKQKPIKLAQNVYLPTKQYPNFNFKGKILGPKGNTLKRLHQETMCNIAIKGRSSMRDSDREEQLRQSGDPALRHLNKQLHVEISTVAPPAEAYARIAYALTEIRKYIVPDNNDEISQEQYRELLEMNPELGKKSQIQRSVFKKLQQMGGGGGDAEEDTEEYEEPKPQATTRARAAATPTSSFVEKTRGLRSKPYQRSTPMKK